MLKSLILSAAVGITLAYLSKSNKDKKKSLVKYSQFGEFNNSRRNLDLETNIY